MSRIARRLHQYVVNPSGHSNHHAFRPRKNRGRVRFGQLQPTTTSSTSQHILDITPVLRLDEFRDLLLGQPLEILDTLRIPSQIGLACHNTTLHKERLLAQKLFPGFFVGLGLSVVVDVVADGVIAYHPGVHVDASGLCKGTFSGLSRQKNNVSHVSIDSKEKEERTEMLGIKR